MEVTNTLAYCDTATSTAVKSFIVLTHCLYIATGAKGSMVLSAAAGILPMTTMLKMPILMSIFLLQRLAPYGTPL